MIGNWEELAYLAGACSSRMTHAQLIAEITGLAEELGLRVFYWPDSRRVSRKGWPDLAIAGDAAWLFREAKTAGGKLTRDQRRIGWTMRAAGFNWAVWRPADVDSGRVRAELRALAGI